MHVENFTIHNLIGKCSPQMGHFGIKRHLCSHVTWPHKMRPRIKVILCLQGRETQNSCHMAPPPNLPIIFTPIKMKYSLIHTHMPTYLYTKPFLHHVSYLDGITYYVCVCIYTVYKWGFYILWYRQGLSIWGCFLLG